MANFLKDRCLKGLLSLDFQFVVVYLYLSVK